MAEGTNTPNMDVVTTTSQALTVDALGKGFAAAMTRQQIIADRKFDELDVEQSQANRYALTGDPNATSGKP